MSVGLSALHKILKDPTRSQIIVLLKEKTQLSYTELLEATGIGSTGRLNYHLKVLGDLLTKNENGQYLLTEKGKLASQLLTEFSKENVRQLGGQNSFKWKDAFWIAFSNGLFLLLMSYFYVLGSVDIYWLFGCTVLFIASIFAAVIFTRLSRVKSNYSPERQLAGAKIGFMLMGAAVGMFGGIFGGGLLRAALLKPLRLAGVSQSLLDFTLWVIAGVLVGIIIGGLGGYIVFKRSKYSKIRFYNPFA